MRGTGRRHFGIHFVLICVSACLFFSSCAPQTHQDAFFSQLKKVDDAITSGKTERARKNLLSMRKQASSASQWLSLVKRERTLDLYDQAVLTLKQALVQLPASESLAAVLTDTLMALGRCDEAITYAKPLLSSPFNAVAARVGVQILSEQGLESQIDPRFCIAAYQATFNPQFIAYAAMLHARKGEYINACDLLLRTVSTEYNHFTALLCYDAALYDRVLSLYTEPHDYTQYAPSELLLLADSHLHIGDIDSARNIWSVVVDKNPRYSPIPGFNLARTESSDLYNANILTRCLEEFPSYFPAIALYSHRARNMPPILKDDPVTQKLRKEGFTSTTMKASLQKQLYNQEKALELISRARADPSISADPRYPIESIRLNSAMKEKKERDDSLVWNLLENHSESAIAYDFALWFFMRSGAYDISFSLNSVHPNGPVSFYTGLEAAMLGKSDTAINSFMEMAEDERLAWIGLANTALIHYRQGEKVAAIEELTTAAALAPDRQSESGIQYYIGVILESMRAFERAESVLGYALELDPDNHLARSLLGKIRVSK